MEKNGILKNKETLMECEYKNIEYEEESNLLLLQKSELFGVANLEAKIIIPIEYKNITFNGLNIVVEKDNITENYNIKEEKQTSNKFKTIQETGNEKFFITIDKDNNYGILNNDDVEVVKNIYTYIEYVYEDYFIASNEQNKLGIINSNGKTIIDFKYDVMQKIKNTNIIQAMTIEDKNVELFSKEMKKIFSMAGANIYTYEEYIKVDMPNEFKYYNLDGVELTNKEVYKDNSLFAICKNDKWGFEDIEGNIKVQPEYESVTEFNKYGFAGVKKDGKWGVIKANGEIIQTPIYKIDSKNMEPDFIGKYYKVYYGGELYYTNEIG